MVSGTKGRAFESRIAHHELKRAFGFAESPFFVCSLSNSLLPTGFRFSRLDSMELECVNAYHKVEVF